MAKALWKIPRRKRVALIEPSDVHEYKAAWTGLAGGLKVSPKTMERPFDKHRLKWSRLLFKGFLSRRVDWIQAGVSDLMPDDNAVLTTEGQTVEYKYLLLAAGAQPDLDSIPGLRAALEDTRATLGAGLPLQDRVQGDTPTKGGLVICTASKQHAEVARDVIADFDEGTAIFTHPRDETAGASQTHSLLFLAQSAWQDRGSVETKLFMGTDEVFPVPKYNETVEGTLDAHGVEVKRDYQLVAVRHEMNEADFVYRNPNGQALIPETVPFDLLCVTPKLVPIPALRDSVLAEVRSGFIDVDPRSLRHKDYENIYAVGDCANTPTMKTAGAALVQSQIAMRNIMASPFRNRRLREIKEDEEERAAYFRLQGERTSYYQGYTSNPIFTSPKKVLLAESEYDTYTKEHTPAETFICNQLKPSRLWKFVMTTVFPRFYWKRTVKGQRWAFGNYHIRQWQLADTEWKQIFNKQHPSEKKD